MKVAMVCEKMSWTYEEYNSQPNWFIETLLIKWNLDGEYQNKKLKQNGK